MDFTLQRKDIRKDGIFGELRDKHNMFFCMTLEHAYPDGEGNYTSKIPEGTYICKRGIHQLHDAKPFETFEVTGIDGHWGILFHIANYNDDLDGCIGLGKGIGFKSDLVGKMITSSYVAFTEFMKIQDGIDEFILTVEVY